MYKNTALELKDFTKTSSSAQNHFKGKDNHKGDQHQYEVNYTHETLHYLLHSSQHSASVFPYIFIDQDLGRFSQQFAQLNLLRTHLKSDVVFIATEPSAPKNLLSIQETYAKSNKAQQYFTGHDKPEDDQREFNVWYTDTTLRYLLHSQPSTHFIPYIFLSPQDCPFSTQFEQLVVLKNMIKRDICFISLEPGMFDTAHFICGVLSGNQLLIINPFGVTQHKDFYTEMLNIKNKYSLDIYISNNTLQHDEKSIVSCGPISAELCLNFLKNHTAACFEKFTIINAKVEQHGLIYQEVSIAKLLNNPLIQLLGSSQDYQQNIKKIRTSHCDLLKPNEILAESDEDFWLSCLNANIQIVMHQLSIDKTSVLNIIEIPEYKKLTTMDFDLKLQINSNHLICGLLSENKLLVIDPVGLTKNKAFYTELAKLQNYHHLEIYLSHNLIQKDTNHSATSGPITIELATHLMRYGVKRCLKEIDIIKQSTTETLIYQEVSLLKLLPEPLQTLMQASTSTDYIQQIKTIRTKHYQLLDYQNTHYWASCFNANIQLVMQQLCVDHKNMKSVMNSKSYQSLAETYGVYVEVTKSQESDPEIPKQDVKLELVQPNLVLTDLSSKSITTVIGQLKSLGDLNWFLTASYELAIADPKLTTQNPSSSLNAKLVSYLEKQKNCIPYVTLMALPTKDNTGLLGSWLTEAYAPEDILLLQQFLQNTVETLSNKEVDFLKKCDIVSPLVTLKIVKSLDGDWRKLPNKCLTWQETKETLAQEKGHTITEIMSETPYQKGQVMDAREYTLALRLKRTVYEYQSKLVDQLCQIALQEFKNAIDSSTQYSFSSEKYQPELASIMNNVFSWFVGQPTLEQINSATKLLALEHYWLRALFKFNLYQLAAKEYDIIKYSKGTYDQWLVNFQSQCCHEFSVTALHMLLDKAIQAALKGVYLEAEQVTYQTLLYRENSIHPNKKNDVSLLLKSIQTEIEQTWQIQWQDTTKKTIDYQPELTDLKQYNTEVGNLFFTKLTAFYAVEHEKGCNTSKTTIKYPEKQYSTKQLTLQQIHLMSGKTRFELESSEYNRVLILPEKGIIPQNDEFQYTTIYLSLIEDKDNDASKVLLNWYKDKLHEKIIKLAEFKSILYFPSDNEKPIEIKKQDNLTLVDEIISLCGCAHSTYEYLLSCALEKKAIPMVIYLWEQAGSDLKESDIKWFNKNRDLNWLKEKAWQRLFGKKDKWLLRQDKEIVTKLLEHRMQWIINTRIPLLEREMQFMKEVRLELAEYQTKLKEKFDEYFFRSTLTTERLLEFFIYDALLKYTSRQFNLSAFIYLAKTVKDNAYKSFFSWLWSPGTNGEMDVVIGLVIELWQKFSENTKREVVERRKQVVEANTRYSLFFKDLDNEKQEREKITKKLNDTTQKLESENIEIKKEARETKDKLNHTETKLNNTEKDLKETKEQLQKTEKNLNKVLKFLSKKEGYRFSGSSDDEDESKPETSLRNGK